MNGIRSRVGALSIRIRIAIIVTVAMVVALVGIGSYVYSSTSAALDRSLNEALNARLSDTTSVVAGAANADAIRALDFVDRDATFVQVADTGGRVLTDSGELDGARVLSGAELRRATASPTSHDRVLEPADPPVRLRVQRVRLGDGTSTVVAVGASRGADLKTLRALRRGLGVGGAVATLLTALIGYLAVAMSLRPVEHMRRQAVAVTADESHRRLPVPATGDELARLAETLNEMLARLDDGIQRERRLTADASHELRTPLALLKMELEVAVAEATQPARQPTTLEEATAQVDQLVDAMRSSESEVDRLVQLSESLLLLATADQGELAIVRTTVDLRQLLDDVASRYARRIEGEGRTLTVEAADEWVTVDPIRLSQAIGNLIDNAIRHAGGAICVTASVEDATLVVHVRDGGAGFGPDVSSRAFERFARGEASRTTRSTGLGLSIVRAIAVAHGGDVTIVDEADGGDVRLRIPAT